MLAVTLRYLSTGDSQQTISFSFRLGRSTVSKIIWATCAALIKVLTPVYMPPPTEESWLKDAKGFSNRWNFPNLVAALDGKHIHIQKPKNSGSNYFNYKHTFSTILLAACDSQYLFTVVNVGDYGRASDGGVFKSCQLGQKLVSGKLCMPPDSTLPNSTTSVPYVMVGDEGFPLLRQLMRPYPGADLSDPRRIFNHRLSRARRCIENAFGILSSHFRIFQRPIIADTDNVDTIVLTTTLLHNFLRRNSESYCPTDFPDRYDMQDRLIPGQWRETVANDSGMTDAGSLGSNNYKLSAEEIRQKFLNYFNSDSGSVPWQFDHIKKGSKQ